MKTGRPGYYIPSLWTLSRDMRNVFVQVHRWIVQMLQVSDEFDMRLLKYSPEIIEIQWELSFATDTWTSPNHKAYVAITVHFE
jgi:hypothetical protein